MDIFGSEISSVESQKLKKNKIIFQIHLPNLIYKLKNYLRN
jgi:hypothetical protein